MFKREPAVIVQRGGLLENTHKVSVAVVDSAGKLLVSCGNPHRQTLIRSAAKPAQALAIMETGGFDEFGFEDADLALMCASHSSEEIHVERTLSMLSKVGATEGDLQCGGHPALSDRINRKWAREDYEPTGLCSNCSGKHVGMIAGAKALGSSVADYNMPAHPMQIAVQKCMAEICDLPMEGVGWGIDGCNLPTPAVPLDRLARLYAKMASAQDGNLGGNDGRELRLAQIYRAMTTYPALVAGEGRFCTLLMEAFEGRLVGKLGADGCYGIGIRASEDTRRLGSSGSVGISVKIEDGNIEILYAAVCEVLEQLDIGSPAVRDKLAAFHHPKKLNTKGVQTGDVSFDISLDAA